MTRIFDFQTFETSCPQADVQKIWRVVKRITIWDKLAGAAPKMKHADDTKKTSKQICQVVKTDHVLEGVHSWRLPEGNKSTRQTFPQGHGNSRQRQTAGSEISRG